MRIVILSDRIPPENVGGAGKVAWSLALGLRATGHEVHVIAATAGPTFMETRDGINTYHLHASYPVRFQAWLSLANPRTVGALRRLLREIRPDVMNAHNIHRDLSYASLTVANSLDIPVVFTSHDAMPFAYTKYDAYINSQSCVVRSYRLPFLLNARQMRLRYNPLRNVAIRTVLKRYAQIRTCVSEAHRRALGDNKLPYFRVVNNGIDPASMSVSDSAVEALRQRLNLTQRRVILFAGRLSAAKGSTQLLLALRQVVERVPDAMVLALSATRWLPSDQPMLNEIQERYVCQGGWLEKSELAAAYRVADVVTVPSIILDCSPMTNLEAMAAGKPLVSTCFGGSSEVVIDDQTGYIVNPFDTATFADRLARLLLDPALRRRMGEAGRQRLLERFTLTGQVEKMTALYAEAIAAASKSELDKRRFQRTGR